MLIIATARVHPAEAPRILTGKQLTVKPCGGSVRDCAVFRDDNSRSRVRPCPSPVSPAAQARHGAFCMHEPVAASRCSNTRRSGHCPADRRRSRSRSGTAGRHNGRQASRPLFLNSLSIPAYSSEYVNSRRTRLRRFLTTFRAHRSRTRKIGVPVTFSVAATANAIWPLRFSFGLSEKSLVTRQPTFDQ